MTAAPRPTRAAPARRALLALAFALCAPVSSAQAPPMTVGILSSGNDSNRGMLERAFLQGLREQGYVEGRNLTVVRRYGSPATVQANATALADLKLDAVLTTCTPSTRAMKDATASTPIVMAAVSDPVRQGIIASLARPGKNVTGTVSQDEDLIPKRVQLIRAILPGATRVAVLSHANNPVHALAWPLVEREMRALGLEPLRYDIVRSDQLAGSMAAAAAAGANALLVMPDDPLMLNLHKEIARLASVHKLPGVYWAREFVDAGGLLSYGQSLNDSYHSAAGYMVKIKRGAAPGTLPVEQPTRFELVVNLAAARALDVDVPQAVLLAADDVLR